MRQEKGFASAVATAALGAAAIAAGVYAANVARTWRRYGQAVPPDEGERDTLLDRFMPAYDVVERHSIHVQAPAETTLDAAERMELMSHPVVRAIFIGRELLLGGSGGRQARKGLLDEVRSLGWGVLAEEADREIVLGAVTKPWAANVTFRAIPAEQFAMFNEPDYVKIAWTLRADPAGAGESVFRTETRAVATDAVAREKFRRYWSFLSPGIMLIRRLSLGLVKSAAERAPDGREQEAPLAV